jgi:WD40 repeat protein
MWIQKVPGGGVTQIAYAPDGKTIYTADRGAKLTAWDVATHARRWAIAVNPLVFFAIKSLSALAAGRVVATSYSGISVWDASDGRELLSANPENIAAGARHLVTPDGRVYYTSDTARQITGWNLGRSAAEPVRRFPDYRSRVASFDLTPDTRLLAVAFENLPVALFDWSAGPDLRNPVVLEDVVATDVRISPDGRTVVARTKADPPVVIWDVAECRPRGRVRCDLADPHGYRSVLFAFNPALPLFAALNAEGVLTLFSTETGAPVRSLDFALGRAVQCITFSPDGLTCAVGGSNKQFAVFDVDL